MKTNPPYINRAGRPRPARCAVWWAAPPEDLRAAAGQLDDAERARCATYVRAGDRARFVGGRVLVRRAVAAELGCDPRAVRLIARCPVCGGAHGKPRVLGVGAAGLDLSIAHAGDRIVVGVAHGCAVGVDVERIGPFEDLTGATANVLDPVEQGVLAALPASERAAAFFAYWTRKEALLKATGQGLAIDLSAVLVTRPALPAALVCGPPPLIPERVRLHDLDVGSGYAACVALIGDGDPVVVEVRA